MQKAIDIPIYGGYDRKENGEQSTSNCHYYRLPYPFPVPDLNVILGMWGCCVSFISKDETSKMILIQLGSGYVTLGVIPSNVKEFLVKAPDVYMCIVADIPKESVSVNFQCNSLQEMVELLASSPEQDEQEKYQKIVEYLLDNEITEEEYNAAIEELKNEVDSN